MIKRASLISCLALVLGMASTPFAAATTLKVGSTPTGVPFTFLDTKTNTIQGVMVDVMAEVAKDSGDTVQIEPLSFSALIPSLTSSKIDVISAAMFATAARKEVIDFTDTVYGYGEALVVGSSDTKEYKSFDDLKGATVGVQVGTAFVEPLKKSGAFAEVKIYDSIQDIMRDVGAGRIKAGFADYPIVAYQIAQGNFPGVRIAPAYTPVVKGEIGIGLRKGEAATLAKFNASIAKMKADGRLAAILKKWGL